MLIKIALSIAVILQIIALVISLSLIKKTKFYIAWIAISMGFLIMAYRRFSDLLNVINSSEISKNDYFSYWAAFLISVLIFISSFYIKRIFSFINDIEVFRKENEIKVLNAVIETEENQRRNFAKELHDGLAPILSAVKMNLSVISNQDNEPIIKELIFKTKFGVDEAIKTTREISNNLSPQVLEKYGLQKAIKRFIDDLNISNNYKVRFESNLDDKKLNSKIEVLVYRIVNELINNTIKHADANEIKLLIYKYKDRVEVFYEDNGKGFIVKNASDSSSGLKNIDSRVKALNGKIGLKTSIGNGMKIQIVLPI